MKSDMESITFVDQLTELGPSTRDNTHVTYSYAEFAGRERVRQVICPVDLQSKFAALLGNQQGRFHLVSAVHLETHETRHILIGAGEEGGPIYAMDPNTRGYHETIAAMRKLRFRIAIFKWIGILLILVGIPLIVLLIGIFLIPLGVSLFTLSRRGERAAKTQLEITILQGECTASIQNVRLV